MNKYILVMMILCSLSLNAKSVGFGVMIGSPTGLSAKYNINNSKGVDLAVSWKVSGDQEFYIHSNYLIKKNNFVKIAKTKFHLFYGGGLRLINRQDVNNSTELLAALRAPVGLSYNLKGYRVEFFGELAPLFEVIPESSVGLNLGLGFRYYL